MGNFEILCGFGIFLLVLYRYLTVTFDFWKKRGIPGPKPRLPFGTMKDIILKKVFIGKYVKDLYDDYENTAFIGIFNMRKPVLMIKDPKIIKDVFIKDSSIFYNRDLPTIKEDPLNNFLLFSTGLTTQHLREKISPIFRPNKIKNMFYSLLEPLKRLDDYLEELLLEDDCVNCENLIERLTIDMIGNCFMGININLLTKETYEENKFLKYFKDVRGANWKGTIRTVMIDLIPQLCYLFGHYMFDKDKKRQFFTDLMNNLIEERKKHAAFKDDFINLLIEMKENPGKLAEITDVTNEFLSAQLYGFFFAGHDTTFTTILNTLYELALNQNIQDKLREEIQNIYNKNQKLQYEDINEMPYLDAVSKETLRKYPVAAVLGRTSTSSYTFKDTKITIPKNQRIIIPVYAIHHDPKIYSNPEVYDPERFIKKESKNSMHYIPFGYGPRYCIGERLGILQIKLGLIGILRKYKVDVCQKTITSYVFHPASIVSHSSKPLFLKITKIS